MQSAPEVYCAQQLQWRAQQHTILNNINFTVFSGQKVGIIGPNGAGKTSLLRCLSGLHKPSGGLLTLFGSDISQIENKQLAKQVAVVSQLLPAQFDATVWDFVSLGVMPHKGFFDTIDAQDKQAIAKALRQTGLTDIAEQSWSSLSGGEKQRAFIARALVQKASVLLLDEPSNHIDIAFQIQLFRLINQLPLTVVMSLHDLNLASSVCDHLLLLHKGEIVAQGEPKTVITTENIARCFGVSCQVNLSSSGKPIVHLDYENQLSQQE